MKSLNITIIIFIVIIILLGIIFIFINYFALKYKNIFTDQEKLVFFLDLDLNKTRIKKNNVKWNKKLSNTKFNDFFEKNIGKGWIDLSYFLNLLENKDAINWKNSIEYCIQNMTNVSTTTNLNSWLFETEFIYINNENIFIKLNSINNIKNDYFLKKIIKKDEIINSSYTYNLFISFSLKKENFINLSHKTFNIFVKKFYDIINFNNINFFNLNNNVVFLFKTNKYYKIEHLKKIIKKKIINPKIKNALWNFYDGVSFVESEKINNESDFTKILIRISFGLIKSKLSNAPFHFNLKNIKFDEFEKYKDKVIYITKVIEENKIDYKIKDVISSKTSKSSFSYYLPHINIEDDFWNSCIIDINDFNNKMIDKFAKNIIKNKDKEKEKNEMILLKINDYTIDKFFDYIKNNKNFIYIINNVKINDVKKYVDLLNLLKNYKIEYGISIDEINSNVLSILKNTKTKYLFISKNITKNMFKKNLDEKLKITDWIILTEKMGVSLIFDEISENNIKKLNLISKSEKFYIKN